MQAAADEEKEEAAEEEEGAGNQAKPPSSVPAPRASTAQERAAYELSVSHGAAHPHVLQGVVREEGKARENPHRRCKPAEDPVCRSSQWTTVLNRWGHAPPGPIDSCAHKGHRHAAYCGSMSKQSPGEDVIQQKKSRKTPAATPSPLYIPKPAKTQS